MPIEIKWNVDRRDAWEDIFNTLPRSNILQSWAYGEAKARVEGLYISRGLINQEGRTIGLVQTLERRCGFARIIRINRGPLWVSSPDREVTEEAFTQLRHGARWWRGRVLLAAPELSEGTSALLRELGYRRRNAPTWQSAWVDLRQTEDALRRQLEVKWRNSLNNSERGGLDVAAESSDEAFSWLIQRHRAFMADRNFQGVPAEIIEEFRAHTVAQNEVLICRARHGDAWIAGALIARHGTSATYLVGWSGSEGRRLRAANLVLFRAMLELAKQGCRWFDVGGIDIARTPGIAHFKNGLGGEPYSLAGEYVAF